MQLWRDMIPMDWVGDNTQAGRKLSSRGPPSSFLINPKGKIVEKDLRASQIVERLSEYLHP